MRPLSRLCAAALCTLGAVALAAPPAAASGAPPSDPSAHGYIGFCDLHDHQVTSGSVAGPPFVWKAVASEPAPPDYQGRGQNAVLNIYQPRPQTLPSDWSGDSLTAATFYTSAARPTVVATGRDIPLSVVVAEFPPLVDGLYELRMYVGRTNHGVYNTTYPATFIRVDGERWNVVGGGAVDCSSGTGESAEVLTGVVSKKDATRVPSPSTTPPRPGGSRSAGAHATGSAARTQAPASAASTATPGSTTPAADSSASHSSGATVMTVLAAAAAGLAAFAGLAWWRRRAN